MWARPALRGEGLGNDPSYPAPEILKSAAYGGGRSGVEGEGDVVKPSSNENHHEPHIARLSTRHTHICWEWILHGGLHIF